ncbi:MAG: cyclic nucleotide-binding domain-containing protein [Chloroflexi bacterium]|nr:cyclic nucleotide-binding domain-containing protein [Chloroflexota bacterium]
MSDVNVPRYAALLKQQYLFQGLSNDQLARVVNRFRRVEKIGGEMIIQQEAAGDSFYVIFEGRVRVTRRERSHTRQLDILSAGDHFGEDALLFDRPRDATVTAMGPVVLLRLERDDFADLIREYPEIRKNLSATAESRRLVHRDEFDWLGEDEVIYLIARKHEVFLILSLLLPVLLVIASVPVLAVSFTASSNAAFNVGIVAGIMMAAAGVVWGVWNWVDWGNDYYIVTNQRVVWLERVVILYYSRREAPMTQVRDVGATTSWLGRILNYGTVRVNTYIGSITMVKMADPAQFVSFVEGYRKRATYLKKDEGSAQLHRDVRQVIGLEKPPPADGGARQEKKPGRKKMFSGLWQVLDTFLQVRYERNGVITYRKHWLVLLRKIWQPGLLLILAFTATGYLLWLALSERAAGLPGGVLALVFAAIYVALFIWLGYQYLDWNNDIYQLTPEQILDIERKPLGEDVRKSAGLGDILTLEHERKGLIRLIFNYGDVIIRVSATQFVFKGVRFPDEVQEDIANYIEAFKRRKASADAEQERTRMRAWLGAYHEENQVWEELQKGPEWDVHLG